MPRVKINYIVSFSSEDSEHPASNLLSWEVSKKKWLCKKGESSCSVVLQLPRAVKISGVHIGAYHAALVEVLVARSETSTDQFQVLVPSSVFVSPGESRRAEGVERVRSFARAHLAADSREQRWDRVRVVCSQPYNKHCKYGLSFIHIDEVEGPLNTTNAPVTVEPKAAVPSRLLTLDTMSSDEDDFKPGELFAKHLQNKGEDQTSSNTGAQIRQATSQALKNMSDSSSQLTKTPIAKPNVRRGAGERVTDVTDRGRDALLYGRDDHLPHDKIDQVIKRHHDAKEKEEKTKPVVVKKDKHEDRNKYDANTSRHTDNRKRERDDRGNDRRRSDDSRRANSSKLDNTSEATKRKQADDSRAESSRGRSTDEARKRRRASGDGSQGEMHELLKDAVLVLSGYEHPRRARVRNAALALGARVAPAWGPGCTHLICAFPNTPKLRQVRASSATTPVATAEWLDACTRARRLLPWQRYATEPTRRVQAPTDHSADEHSDCDTDDEIQKVIQNQKKRRTQASPSPTKCDSSPTNSRSKSPTNSRNKSPTNSRSKSPTNSRDKSPTNSRIKSPQLNRQKSSESIRSTSPPRDRSESPPSEDVTDSTSAQDNAATDVEDDTELYVPYLGGALPSLFAGLTFSVDAGAAADDIARYLRAYGGLVIDVSEVSADSPVDYVVVGEGCSGTVAGAKRVSARWLANCHKKGALLPAS